MLTVDMDELEVSGSGADLKSLADCIRNAQGFASDDVVVSLKRPSWLQVTAASGPVKILRKSGKICIEGSSDKLAVLANSIESLAGETPTQGVLKPHLHIEYVPGHFYLDQHSDPLVVTLDE
jgi:hypothetical protein